MNYIEYGKEIIHEEGLAVKILHDIIDERFSHAINLILETKGRVIVTGVGKSGHIGKKIAATLSSTGTHAFFIHPSEASHGDLGMIAAGDIVLALSKSGESHELSDIIHYCKRFNIKLISITQNPESALGKASDCVVLLPAIKEAGPHNLAPTTSTTLTAILGDAIAICCMRQRSFSPQEFKNFHPGGKLGQKLTQAREVMHSDMLPLVTEDILVMAASIQMSQGMMGCVGVIDAHGKLIGIFTDGDLRRHLTRKILESPIGDYMTPKPYMISPDTLISEVSEIFSTNKISSIFVCEDKKPVGIIHIQDLLKNKFM